MVPRHGRAGRPAIAHAHHGWPRRSGMDGGRRLPRRRVPADGLDARAVVGGHPFQPVVDRVAAPGAHADLRARRAAKPARGRSDAAPPRVARGAVCEPRRARALVGADRMARRARRAARRRGRIAAAVPVGCVDPVGDQGARVVCARRTGAVRARRGVVRCERRGVLRRLAGISADGAAAAGVVLHRAGALGRRAHELAVACDRRRARAGGLRRHAAHGPWTGAGDRRCRVCRDPADARRARRTGGLRGPADGCGTTPSRCWRCSPGPAAGAGATPS